VCHHISNAVYLRLRKATGDRRRLNNNQVKIKEMSKACGMQREEESCHSVMVAKPR
jgi:hypothetical protein